MTLAALPEIVGLYAWKLAIMYNLPEFYHVQLGSKVQGRLACS